MYVPQTTVPLAAALSLALAATPTVAAAKETKVTMPASALKDPAARICMPRAMSKTVGKDKTQPQTLCQTVEAWATHGVTVVAK